MRPPRPASPPLQAACMDHAVKATAWMRVAAVPAAVSAKRVPHACGEAGACFLAWVRTSEAMEQGEGFRPKPMVARHGRVWYQSGLIMCESSGRGVAPGGFGNLRFVEVLAMRFAQGRPGNNHDIAGDPLPFRSQGDKVSPFPTPPLQSKAVVHLCACPLLNPAITEPVVTPETRALGAREGGVTVNLQLLMAALPVVSGV